ncbi:MAG: hypothetical protein ACREMP_05660 [Candidatus Tyrphobacter sp.]
MIRQAVLPAPNTRAARVWAIVAEGTPWATLCTAIAWVYHAYYGHYAFDDSYFGYSNAQSLLLGHGFSFNGGDHVLSTSAPLAVPLYAISSWIGHASVVNVAQFWSAIAFAVVAFGSYLVLREYCTRFGALIASLALLASPFLLPTWSHETLLYMATVVGGLLLYLRRRYTSAALVLGCAALFRGEALLLLPFLWYAHRRSHGTRAALRLAALSIAPYAVWALGASLYFGSPFSDTIAAKHAQLRYAVIPPYLAGLGMYAVSMYRALFTPFFDLTLVCLIAAVVACAARRAFASVCAWVAATTALYVVLGLPCYFWFCTQWAVFTAAVVALPWMAKSTRVSPLLQAARIASIGLALLNVTFGVVQLQPDQRYAARDWAIEPRIAGNAYISLARWFVAGHRHGSVAFTDLGQLHYYSGLPIVDDLGIVTAGAAKHFADGNAIWTFKRYRPRFYVHTDDLIRIPSPIAGQPARSVANFDYIAAPLEYDWFRDAYRAVGSLHVSDDDPRRSDFTIYELRFPRFVPQADERDDSLRVLRVARAGDSIAFAFVPSRSGVTELEARLRARSACDIEMVLRGPGGVRIARRTGYEGITRVTMQLAKPLQRARYTWTISSCAALATAPPPLLRKGFVWWVGAPTWGGPADALVAYSSSGDADRRIASVLGARRM